MVLELAGAVHVRPPVGNKGRARLDAFLTTDGEPEFLGGVVRDAGIVAVESVRLVVLGIAGEDSLAASLVACRFLYFPGDAMGEGVRFEVYPHAPLARGTAPAGIAAEGRHLLLLEVPPLHGQRPVEEDLVVPFPLVAADPVRLGVAPVPDREDVAGPGRDADLVLVERVGGVVAVLEVVGLVRGARGDGGVDEAVARRQFPRRVLRAAVGHELRGVRRGGAREVSGGDAPRRGGTAPRDATTGAPGSSPGSRDSRPPTWG